MNLRPLRLVAFTATPGGRNDITELFVGKNIIKGSNTKPWTVCFPAIKTDINAVKLKRLVDESM